VPLAAGARTGDAFLEGGSDSGTATGGGGAIAGAVLGAIAGAVSAVGGSPPVCAASAIGCDAGMLKERGARPLAAFTVAAFTVAAFTVAEEVGASGPRLEASCLDVTPVVVAAPETSSLLCETSSLTLRGGLDGGSCGDGLAGSAAGMLATALTAGRGGGG
jgi:hypothetical protein